jgi:hypothetical protein
MADNTSDPFAPPGGIPPGVSQSADRQTFQNFVSATPLPGYVFSPELALYVDPNMPEHLRPNYVKLKGPQGNTAVVPFTGKRPDDFLAMMQQPVQLDQGTSPGYGPPSPEMSMDAFIAGPTQRPNEPLTAGVPFGPGPTFTRYSGESDAQFRSRVGTSIMQQGALAADPNMRSFALRLMEGD